MTSQMTLEKHLQEVNPRGITDVLNSQAGQISRIIYERGDAEVKAMLVLQIDKLLKFFNFNRSMDGEQVMETVNLIIESFPIYMPEDFILCFKNIKLLKYGKFFEGIDGAKILEMMAAYDLEREDQIIQVRQKEANQYKADNRLMAEPVAELAKKILDKPKEVKEPVKPREKNEAELRMDGYMSDFDKLHVSQGSKSLSGMKFVHFGGNVVDLQTYCNLRFSEEFL